MKSKRERQLEKIEKNRDLEFSYQDELARELAVIERIYQCFSDYLPKADLDKLNKKLDFRFEWDDDTAIYENLIKFSRKLGKIPKDALENLATTLEPAQIFYSINPKGKKVFSIDSVLNIEGKPYIEITTFEGSAPNPETGDSDKADLQRKLCLYDGSEVDGSFINGKMFEYTEFVSSTAQVQKAGSHARVWYKDTTSPYYDSVSHLFDFNEKRLAYVVSKNSKHYLVIEEKEHFGRIGNSKFVRDQFSQNIQHLYPDAKTEIIGLIKYLQVLSDRIDDYIKSKLDFFRVFFLVGALEESFKQQFTKYYRKSFFPIGNG
ncbi:MAG: hypothetical protein GY866_28070 [Proteobacteria bacterium]|nr:hypothetical protein [Pseudomonadota bacterium]